MSFEKLSVLESLHGLLGGCQLVDGLFKLGPHTHLTSTRTDNDDVTAALTAGVIQNRQTTWVVQ